MEGWKEKRIDGQLHVDRYIEKFKEIQTYK
jgi:hypothetical protein